MTHKYRGPNTKDVLSMAAYPADETTINFLVTKDSNFPSDRAHNAGKWEDSARCVPE